MSWSRNFIGYLEKVNAWFAAALKDNDKNSIYYRWEYLSLYENEEVLENETFARRLLFTGEYVYIDKNNQDEYADETDRNEAFKDFAEAYHAFCKLEQSGRMNAEQRIQACKSLIVIFNKQYFSIPETGSKTFINDYPKFFRVVQLLLECNVHVLIKADLYRQISMFKKCIELLNYAYLKTDCERELCDEIRYRACENIRHPFMLYDVVNLRKLNVDNTLGWFFDVHYVLSHIFCLTPYLRSLPNINFPNCSGR